MNLAANLTPVFSTHTQSVGSSRTRVAQLAGADFSAVLGAVSSAQSSGGIGNLLAATPAGKLSGLSASGRNEALFDPESAYQMMTTINQKEVLYKTQRASLQEMGDSLTDMQVLGQRLANLSDTTGVDAARAVLQDFTDRYNQWSRTFGDRVDGGALAGTKAAKIARRALEQSVGNMFIGAKDGLRGLQTLGVSISPVTHRATFDHAQFDATFKAAPGAALSAVREFGAHFARSAELLAAPDNFIANQLGNLQRAIGFIAENHSAWQSEFGTGDAPKLLNVMA